MMENMGNGYIKIGVKQEELENAICGLEDLKPVLQAVVLKSNEKNRKQGLIDAADIGKHFDTAITSMKMLLCQFPDYVE